jgi:ankyrin repeat protein
LTKGGIQAVHLAAIFGDLKILRILHFKFNADFHLKTDRGLTPLHSAAKSLNGIVTIYFLNDVLSDFDPNVRDMQGASPLHYAIMSIEENNVQALLSLGSDINFQDNKGDTMLHVALARYIDD